MRESGFRNAYKSGILRFGFRNTAQGIQNTTNDWNPESKTMLDSLTRGDQLKGLRHGWLVYFANDKQL